MSNLEERWNMLMYRFKKAEEYFSRQDISMEEKLEFEPDLHELLGEISVASIARSEMQNQLTIFREG